MSRETKEDKIAKIIHDLVSSEISRVEEIKAGAVRKDGGRLMCEITTAIQIVDLTNN